MAAHYFDDVFHSSRADEGQTRIRRSSTSRSIGNRKSFGVSLEGHHHLQSTDDEIDRERRKSEANEHVAKYVTQALERLRTSDSLADYDEELETLADS